MKPEDRKRLVEAAIEARKNAVAPYSRFYVGAAILTADDRIFTGVNVESASYGLTCCAERVALFKALSEGAREFLGVAVVASTPGGPTPCGACRQLLAEYAPKALVLIADHSHPESLTEYSVEQLLPVPFVLFSTTI